MSSFEATNHFKAILKVKTTAGGRNFAIEHYQN